MRPQRVKAIFKKKQVNSSFFQFKTMLQTAALRQAAGIKIHTQSTEVSPDTHNELSLDKDTQNAH